MLDFAALVVVVESRPKAGMPYSSMKFTAAHHVVQVYSLIVTQRQRKRNTQLFITPSAVADLRSKYMARWRTGKRTAIKPQCVYGRSLSLMMNGTLTCIRFSILPRTATTGAAVAFGFVCPRCDAPIYMHPLFIRTFGIKFTNLFCAHV